MQSRGESLGGLPSRERERRSRVKEMVVSSGSEVGWDVAERTRNSFESREVHSHSDRYGNAAWCRQPRTVGWDDDERGGGSAKQSRWMDDPSRQRENGSASRMSRQMTTSLCGLKRVRRRG